MLGYKRTRGRSNNEDHGNKCSATNGDRGSEGTYECSVKNVDPNKPSDYSCSVIKGQTDNTLCTVVNSKDHGGGKPDCSAFDANGGKQDKSGQCSVIDPATGEVQGPTGTPPRCGDPNFDPHGELEKSTGHVPPPISIRFRSERAYSLVGSVLTTLMIGVCVLGRRRHSG